MHIFHSTAMCVRARAAFWLGRRTSQPSSERDAYAFEQFSKVLNCLWCDNFSSLICSINCGARCTTIPSRRRFASLLFWFPTWHPSYCLLCSRARCISIDDWRPVFNFILRYFSTLINSRALCQKQRNEKWVKNDHLKAEGLTEVEEWREREREAAEEKQTFAFIFERRKSASQALMGSFTKLRHPEHRSYHTAIATSRHTRVRLTMITNVNMKHDINVFGH